MWREIKKHNPDIWVWAGDIIYSDTNNMNYLRKNYRIQKQNPYYNRFIATTEITGSWDDHDYGLNDGGTEYPYKK